MNAIILAAGLGQRLRPLTNDRPKCLVEVVGTPIIERQIQFLKDIGIHEICVIGGYKIEMLEYLIDKYNINLIFNELYDKANNIYSLYKVLNVFGDSYVIEGDVYLWDNCFVKSANQSFYLAVNKKYENEWGLITDNNNYLQKVEIGDGNGFIMSGISYWTKSDAEIIKTQIEHLISNGDITKLFWDNAVINTLDKLSPIKILPTSSLYEIDSVSDLNKLNQILLNKI